MLSPFLGLSIVIHLLILFLYQLASFAHRLVFGFRGKPMAKRRITVLSRINEERALPTFVIATVISTISGLAFFTLRASYETKPNTMDMIAGIAETSWDKNGSETAMPEKKNQQNEAPVRVQVPHANAVAVSEAPAP